MDELKLKVSNLEKRLGKIEKNLNLAEKTKEIRELEAESMKSDFWTDVFSAKKTMQKISNLQKELADFTKLKEEVISLKELIDLASKSSDKETSKDDLEGEIKKTEERLEKLEVTLFLSGQYDHENAILSVHAGQGGVEAMDWAAMLLRMYLRYAEKSGWTSELIEETKGEEAGVKSATVELRGVKAYGMLKKEAGTHRLVRQSPFNADALRQTSFALVEVIPVIEGEKEIEIKPDDLELETFRSSAPGGQNVQKVNSAVRIRHKPSGLVVGCQSERSQAQNRENAMKILIGKLSKQKEQEQESLEKDLKGPHKTASWGNQIRSYVLHPYKMVKDLRTDFESSDPQKVLDGELDGFIEAEVKLEKT
jgi:peptide chain release factor 2